MRAVDVDFASRGNNARSVNTVWNSQYIRVEIQRIRVFECEVTIFSAIKMSPLIFGGFFRKNTRTRDNKALVIFARLCAFDVGNSEAHSVFAHNSYMRGDYALCRAELDVARQANPFDLSGEYLHGVGLFMLGEWEEGTAIIKQLMLVPCNKPDWYVFIRF